MSTMRARTVAIAVLIMMAGACGGTAKDNAAPAGETTVSVEPPDSRNPVETSGSGDSIQPTDSSVTPTEPSSEPSSEPTVETTATKETVPVVTIEVVGTAVGGNSGGVGEDNTQSLSETIRNEDGSCSGWKGPGDAGRWTQGLENGAPVKILDRNSNREIGEGSIRSSSWADVDPGDNEQWNCTFDFTGTISEDVDSFKIKVADLQPWLAVADPTKAGSYVSSVDTKIELSRISSCTEREAGQPITEWHTVGQFWGDGLETLCFNGLVVAKIERPCRAPNEGSEYITRVVSASDPSVVYEDANGLQVDPETLPPDTGVIVDIATGRPC